MITINSDEKNNSAPCCESYMDQRYYPFRICDVQLPQCNTGYVYMLISTIYQKFGYIGITKLIRMLFQSHKSGTGYSAAYINI